MTSTASWKVLIHEILCLSRIGGGENELCKIQKLRKPQATSKEIKDWRNTKKQGKKKLLTQNFYFSLQPIQPHRFQITCSFHLQASRRRSTFSNMVIPPPAAVSSSRIKALQVAAKSSSLNSPTLARKLLARHRNPLLLNPTSRASQLSENRSRWGPETNTHQDSNLLWTEGERGLGEEEEISLHRNSRAARFGSKRLGALILNAELKNATMEMVQGE